MTEQEWLTAIEPQQMLRRVCRRTIRSQPRKGHLFAVACCQRIWHLLTDPRSREAVDVTARFADGLATEDQLRTVAIAAQAAHGDAFAIKGKVGACAEWAAEFTADVSAWHSASRGSGFACVAVGHGLRAGPEHEAQSHLLRCIFGNPFRPVTLDPSWLTSTVTALAQGIYEDRAFDRLPILADALQDAGCDNPEILNHCRSAGPHVRGCWIVDLLLDKS